MLKSLMLKTITVALAMVSGLSLAQNIQADLQSQKIVGILVVKHMTEGRLMWLKGRVGEGKYTRIDEKGRHCTLEVPVAIGAFSEAQISVRSSNGIAIVITNSELSEKLVSGGRINSTDWVFSQNEGVSNSDGYVLSGLEPSEGFVLNSRRRWVSWLLDDKPSEVCI